MLYIIVATDVATLSVIQNIYFNTSFTFTVNIFLVHFGDKCSVILLINIQYRQID